MKVVFTGPAFDNTGHSIVREDLIAACAGTGKFQVQASVRKDTELVVASRTDTVKAKAASARGLTVLTYPQFINRFLAGVELNRGSRPNKFTDVVDQDLLVPDFAKPSQGYLAKLMSDIAGL